MELESRIVDYGKIVVDDSKSDGVRVWYIPKGWVDLKGRSGIPRPGRDMKFFFKFDGKVQWEGFL